MSTYVLVPGAGGDSWYWSYVARMLTDAGHQVTAVDLPGSDETAGLPEYVDLVGAATRDRDDVVLVAQSLGGFTAPLAALREPVRAIVLVNAMIPAPGEKVGDWWDATGWAEARSAAAVRGGYPVEFDLATYFLHDVDPEVAAASARYQRPEGDAVFESVCDFPSWPDVPLRVVAGADDRFFPVEFQQRLARERLGVDADVLPGGHLIALSQPRALADHLLGV